MTCVNLPGGPSIMIWEKKVYVRTEKPFNRRNSANFQLWTCVSGKCEGTLNSGLKGLFISRYKSMKF